MQLFQSHFQEKPFICTLIAACLSAILYFIYRSLRRHIEVSSFKKQHGCYDPPRYPHKDRIWGSDLVKERATALKEGKYFTLYESQFERYGRTFEEFCRRQKTINTIEPVNIRHVLALACDDYMKDPARVRAQAPFMGPSVFSDGPIWKPSRALVKPIFARAELSDMDHLAMFTDRFIELLPSDGSMVDVQPLLHKLFFDVATDFIFGEPLGALQPSMPASSADFIQSFKKALMWASKRREAGWLSWRYNHNKEWIDSYTKVHRWVDRQVARALKETEKIVDDIDGDTKASQPVQRRYVLLNELAKRIRDPIDLRYQVLGVFLPAVGGTANAVGNVLFQLARHPEMWKKLRQDALKLGDEPLTFEKLKSLSQFRYVVLETIRLIGPAARVVRYAKYDTTLPSGGGPDRKSPIFVAKGTSVSMSTWGVQHDADIWEEPQEWKPERWRNRKIGWEFVPFSGGPRICPAQQQVLTHTVYLLVRLVKRFEGIENWDGVREFVQRVTVTVESGNGVKVGFKPAISESRGS